MLHEKDRSRHLGGGRRTSHPTGCGKRCSAVGRQAVAHGLAPEAIEEFLAELAALIEPVEVHFQWRPQSRDPNDEMVLEAAINGRADALVTYNVADFAGPAERFRISVLRPGDLLKKVKP